MSDVTAADLIGSFKELNMCNYTEDDVGELLHWSLLAFDVLSAPVAVPDGWKLVPIEPTLEMGWAYLDAAREANPEKSFTFSHPGYRAMLAAAPPAAQQPGTVTTASEQRLEILQRLVVVSEALNSTAREKRLANMDAGRLIREAIEMLKAGPLAKPAAEQPDTMKVRRELMDRAARSCANGWIDYPAAQELRALLDKEGEA